MSRNVKDLKATTQTPSARFAMSRLEFGPTEDAVLPLSAPPYEFTRADGAYEIYFNMLGIPAEGIKTGYDQRHNRFTVFAERENRRHVDQFLWVFSMPGGVDLNSARMVYKNGAVQFHFPEVLAS